MPLDNVHGWTEVGELEGIDTIQRQILLGRAGRFRHGLLVSGNRRSSPRRRPRRRHPRPPPPRRPRSPHPPLEILALENLAEHDGKSVDAVLTRELLDVVSADSDYLATAIPGFTAALRWPQ